MPESPPPPGTGASPPLSAAKRGLYLALAWLSLALGILGAFLPVLPTTPFILLSAWAAARSSPRLLRWLENHTVFAPMIRDWRRGGVVSRRAKWMATLMMGASGLYLLLGTSLRWSAWAAIACMATVAAWLWRRPETGPASPGDSGESV